MAKRGSADLRLLLGLLAIVGLSTFLFTRKTKPLEPASTDIDIPVVKTPIVDPVPLTPEQRMAALVKQTISAHKVAIFSKSYCPYCAKAKAAMSKFLSADKFFVMELDQRNDGDEIQDALAEVTGGRSVPRVFIDGNFIGGGDDTARKAENGELKQLLTAAGVL